MLSSQWRKKSFIDTNKILLGNLIMGLAYAKWMVPHKIINGGVTSTSLILKGLTDIPLLYLSNGLQILLLLIAWLFLGRNFFLRTLAGSLSYAFFFSLFYLMPFALSINIYIDIALACLCVAIGYYCCITSNSSTAGMDVIALVLKKYNEKVNIARAIRYINYIVLALGLLVYGWVVVAIGIIFVYACSWILEKMLQRYERQQASNAESL